MPNTKAPKLTPAQQEQALLQAIRDLMENPETPVVMRSRWMLTLRYVEGIGAGDEWAARRKQRRIDRQQQTGNPIEAEEVPTLELVLPKQGKVLPFLRALVSRPDKPEVAP